MYYNADYQSLHILAALFLFSGFFPFSYLVNDILQDLRGPFLYDIFIEKPCSHPRTGSELGLQDTPPGSHQLTRFLAKYKIFQ